MEPIKNTFVNRLTILVLILCFGLLSLPYFLKDPALHTDAEKLQIPVFGVIMLVLQFHFGSTRSSREKDQTIREMQGKINPSTNEPAA